MPRRRILFLSTGLSTGGAETQVVRIAVALSRRDWNVQVVSIRPPDRLRQPALPAMLDEAGIPLVSLDILGVPSLLSGVTRLARLILQFRPEVLVSFMIHANLLGRVVGRTLRVPVIISSVRSANFGGQWRYWLLGFTDRFATATVANSQRVADDLVSRRSVSRRRMHVIPNGIETLGEQPHAEQRAALRAELGVTEGDFLWMAIGNLVPPKDYPTLLRAFAHLCEDPSIRPRLRVIGHGPLDKSLAELTLHLGLTDRVHFIGFRSNASQYLAAADAFVLSSVTEGMPNALVEAMLVGLPAVGTDVGGVSELLRHGETGLLVPHGDPLALSVAMGAVGGMSTESRRQLGSAGRARIQETSALSHVVSRWEGLFLQ